MRQLWCLLCAALLVSPYADALAQLPDAGAPAPAPREAEETQVRPSPSPSPPPAPKKRRSKALLIGGGVAAVGTGVVVAATSGKKEDPLERDDDGDGLTERAGDCDDTRAFVKPGGTITASVSSLVAGRIVNCNDVERITVTVTNYSCQAVTVTRFEARGAVLSGRCTIGDWSMRPDTTQVLAGNSAQIIEARQVYSGSGGVGCCWPQGCTGAACVFGETYTVVTDQGTIDAGTMSYTTVFSDCEKVCKEPAAAGLTPCPLREP